MSLLKECFLLYSCIKQREKVYSNKRAEKRKIYLLHKLFWRLIIKNNVKNCSKKCLKHKKWVTY